MSRDVSPSPLSLPVNIRRLPRKGETFDIEADPAMRTALALEHDLSSVESFHAEINVKPWKRDGIHVSGKIVSNIVQSCVVSLEPLPARIEEPFTATFVPEGSRLARPEMDDGEMILDAEGADAPEIFSGHTIDVGAVAEEFFALALDPYPRKPGTELPSAPDVAGETTPSGPLQEQLKKLRPKK